MNKPICLDLFCGGGGAAEGLIRAGFDVFGIDINKNCKKNYPGIFFCHDFTKEDWSAVWKEFYSHFPHRKAKQYTVDFIWASPPCQKFSVARRQKDSKTEPVDLIDETRAFMLTYLLFLECHYYCIENVPGAPIREDLVLSGPAFGLNRILRNRKFEMNFLIKQPKIYYRYVCDPVESIVVSKFMGSKNMRKRRKEAGLPPRPTKIETLGAMGITHNMTREEIGEAVPPAYSEYIGKRVIELLNRKDIK